MIMHLQGKLGSFELRLLVGESVVVVFSVDSSECGREGGGVGGKE
jgi:hypothetical protein